MEMVMSNSSFEMLTETELMEVAGRFNCNWHDFGQNVVFNAFGGAASGALYGAWGGTLALPGIGTVGGAAWGGAAGFVAGGAWGSVGYAATCWW